MLIVCRRVLIGIFLVLQQSYGQWQIVFGVLACTYFFGGIVYVLFGSGELQPWNNPPEKCAEPEAAVEEEVPLKKNNGAAAVQ